MSIIVNMPPHRITDISTNELIDELTRRKSEVFRTLTEEKNKISNRLKEIELELKLLRGIKSKPGRKARSKPEVSRASEEASTKPNGVKKNRGKGHYKLVFDTIREMGMMSTSRKCEFDLPQLQAALSKKFGKDYGFDKVYLNNVLSTMTKAEYLSRVRRGLYAVESKFHPGRTE